MSKAGIRVLHWNATTEPERGCCGVTDETTYGLPCITLHQVPVRKLAFAATR